MQDHTGKSATGQAGGCWNWVSISMKTTKLWSMLFPSHSSSVLLRQLRAFLWLEKVGVGFSEEKSSSLVMKGGKWYISGGRWGMESILHLQIPLLLFQQAWLPCCWHRLLHSYWNSVPLGKSLLFPCPEPALLHLIKLVWVAGLTWSLLPICCHRAVFLCCLGSLMEKSCLHSIMAYGAPVLCFWGRKLSQIWQEEFFLFVWWTVTIWVLLLRMYPHLWDAIFKRRKYESWGAMLMLSIYVYLLWGRRQRELSNTLVKCLEDLRIKLKPTEVSCKSRCALLGACIVYLLLDTVKYCSWKTWECSVLSVQEFTEPRAAAEILPSRQTLLLCWKSHLSHIQGRDVSVPLGLCLQHHRSRYLHAQWEQARLGTSWLLPAPLQESQRGVRWEGLLQYKLLEFFIQSLLGMQGCWCSCTLAYGMFWH